MCAKFGTYVSTRVCPRCKDHNAPVSRFCTKCGLPLDQNLIEKVETERKNSDNLMNKLMENPEFKDFMMKKIFEMGLMNQTE